MQIASGRMTPLTRFAGIAAAVLMFAACGSDGDTSAEQSPTTTTSAAAPAATTAPTTSSAAPTTTAAASPDVEVETVADIQRVIAPLGLECSDEDSALFCNRGGDSWQFRISPNGDGDAAFRKSACQADASYNSSGAITDGEKFVVYAGNDGQDVEGFRTELAGLGLDDLEIERGC